jgi:hypothetical protein
MLDHNIWNTNTAFAVNAEAKITGMLETYINLIGYTALNPLYFVETIGISIFIPCVNTSIKSIPAVRHSPKILGS